MKIIKLDQKAPRPTEMTLGFDPMTVWLTNTEALEIEQGDTIEEVSKALRQILPIMTLGPSRNLTALWFAMGERRADQKGMELKWTRTELDPAPGRRYLRRRLPRTGSASHQAASSVHPKQSPKTRIRR